MSQPSPTIITATELKQKSGEIMRRAVQTGEVFLVKRGGYPTVVIVAQADYAKLLGQANQSDPDPA